MSNQQQPNALIHESSPYLLQHAYNPVQWLPWGEATLQKARSEQKLILVSVGYSACHWCHVMEHESFEDEKVARIMNDHFICIKVDREERPDIDQVYMTAVQLMTGHGGWPLNCFTLPDGRPLYGGTYFPKQRWIEILINLAELWKNDPEKCMQYATDLTQGVNNVERYIKQDGDAKLDINIPLLSWEHWNTRIDQSEGGPNRAPKFPLPNNYAFLLHLYSLTKNEAAFRQTELTLQKMADGGIYDQVGGGFARYSTDMMWKVPHFEKMLYDNAQLVSMYADAYRLTNNAEYARIVRHTLKYIAREMTTPEGAFYSAQDADSEGVEGKFYTWKKEELEAELGDDFKWFADLYNVNSIGYWEDEVYILLKRESLNAVAPRYGFTPSELESKVEKVMQHLYDVRSRRVWPGLDDKILTSWNAWMIRGYADAWLALGDDEYKLAALKCARFIEGNVRREDGGLFHTWKNGKATVNGFLEDYAAVIDAYIALHTITGDTDWLIRARDYAHYVLTHFGDDKSDLLFFTSDLDPALVARKYEVSDNVIPASNSIMAHNLLTLGLIFGESTWIECARRMTAVFIKEMTGYGEGYSNWLKLLLRLTYPAYEVAIVGNHVDKIMAEFRQYYRPNEIFAGSANASEVPLLQHRYQTGETLIYVCKDFSCQRPVKTVAEAVSLIDQ